MFSCKSSTQNDKAALFLLVAIGFACMPHIGFQPLSVIAIGAICLTWRVAFLLQWCAAPPKFVQAVMAATALILIMRGQHYDLGKDAGISLLITALTIKQIQHQDKLNFSFSVCLAYFVAAAAFLYDHSLFAFFCVGQAVVFASLALHAGASPEQITPKINVPTNYSIIARLLGYATPLTLLLFFLTPDFKGPLWELPHDAFKAQTGLSSQMAPGKISALMDSDEVAFRARFTRMPKNIKSLYWRGPVFTYFDGQTWQSAGDNIKSPGLQKTSGTASERGFWKAVQRKSLAQGKQNDNEYQITLEPQYNRWLFTLTTPTHVQPGFYLTAEDELLSKTVVSQPLQYTLKVSSPNIGHRETPDKRRYLRLPNLYGPKTKALVKRLQRGLDSHFSSDAQFVTKVLDYFRDHPYYYSKKPPRLKYDPVDEFMLKTKTGFCEHFASAFTFMMRAAGIPARVVTGYRGGEYNPVGGYIIVRQSNAHAWSEVWLQGHGWVRVDPTAVIPAYRVETDSGGEPPFSLAGIMVWDSGALGDWMDNLSYRWYAFLAKVVQARMDHQWLQWFLQARQYLLLCLLSLLTTALVWCRYRGCIQNTDPVLQAYERFCLKLSRLGLSRLPHESANGYALRVSEARPDLKCGVKTIASLYNQLRYGRCASDATYRQFCREISDFRP